MIDDVIELEQLKEEVKKHAKVQDGVIIYEGLRVPEMLVYEKMKNGVNFYHAVEDVHKELYEEQRRGVAYNPMQKLRMLFFR